MKKTNILIIWLIFLVLISSVSADDLTDKWNVAYTFESDPSASNLIDQIGGNDSISDDVQGRVSGANNYAWDFDVSSTDNVNIPYTIGTFGKFSVSMWVNYETDVAYQDFLGLTAGDYNYDLGTGATTDAIWVRMGYDGGYNDISNTSIVITTGVWYHYCFTYDEGVEMVIYRDGEAAGRLTGQTNVQQPSVAYIGSRATGTGRFFNGMIDETTIYNRVLTHSECALLASNTSAGFYPFAAPDTNPPNIDGAIVTSGISGTNDTIDPTPTVNSSLSKAGTSCISNQSTGTFEDCVGRGGKCTVAELDTKGVCTLPENQSLFNYFEFTPVYLWANDTLGNFHSVYNRSVDIQLLPLDTCTYNSSNWKVNCSDNCIINTEFDLGGNNLILDNEGFFNLETNIYNIKNITLNSGCNLTIGSGNITFMNN